MRKSRKILIVPDKFKGSATAVEVASALSELVRRRAVGGEDAVITALPLADGGDGSLEVLRSALGERCSLCFVDAVDSLMRPFSGPLLLFDDGHSAFIEMAAVCGLAMLEPSLRNPERTTTYGLGLMIVRALERGARRIVIGIGGSSTNDCGEGMLRALACSPYRDALLGAFDDRNELCRPSFPETADAVYDNEVGQEQIGNVEILVACDVNNPLLGPSGATMVYGPQKGADPQMLLRLEERLSRFARRWGIDASLPGGGAAGGVGAALRHFLGAKLVPGWQLFGDMVGLEDAITFSDVVITAEGRLDGQSLSGKLVDGVATLCRRSHRPLDVFCGQTLLKSPVCRKAGIWNVFSLMEIESDRHRSIVNAASLLSGRGILVAGCDEAGRGCLAGPVFAAAVILPEDFYHPLIDDSKKLSEEQRDMLRPIIESSALAWCVAQVSPSEIDRINILKASILAMHRALDGLQTTPQMILVDGNRFEPYKGIPFHCMVKGDSRSIAIAAASILAKTHRDEYMKRIAEEYPQYGWERNMAYPTEEHREAIRKFGVTPYHRMSYNLLPEEGRLF